VRKELFPPDRGLQARMIAALVTAALSAAAAIAVVVWLVVAVAWWAAVIVVGFALDGFLERPDRRRPARPAKHPRQAKVRRLVDRLCAVGDMPVPTLVIEGDDAPLTWTTARPWRTPTVHVTSGLLDACDTAELEAILAHELSHIANRDVWVMTILAGPPSWILDGIRVYWRERHTDDAPRFATIRYAMGMVVFASWSAALALPWALTARAVSRHRELAADRGAALLTGSPAQVAAALRALSETAAMPDLRLTLLTPLPARERTRSLWATHPPLGTRVARLERMEVLLQTR
jgi:heat shock protein HtpX